MTDLGTEFGVEVSNTGTTETHVFLGEVQVATISSRGSADKHTCVIRAGQFAHVEHNEAITLGDQPVGESAKRFTRMMPVVQEPQSADAYAKLVLSMKPVVYYRMEEWPKASKSGSYIMVDSAPGAHHGELHVDQAYGQPRCAGKFGGALDLHGSQNGEYPIVSDYPQSDNRQLSVSAWVWAFSLDPWESIVQNWWYPGGGRLSQGQFSLGITDQLELLVQIRTDTER